MVEIIKHKDHGECQMVTNLSTGETLYFSGTDATPEYLLLYGWFHQCGGLEDLFKVCRDGNLELFIETYRKDFETGKHTMALYDWCVLLKRG